MNAQIDSALQRMEWYRNDNPVPHLAEAAKEDAQIYAAIAQAEAAERIASALERIAAVLEGLVSNGGNLKVERP